MSKQNITVLAGYTLLYGHFWVQIAYEYKDRYGNKRYRRNTYYCSYSSLERIGRLAEKNGFTLEFNKR